MHAGASRSRWRTFAMEAMRPREEDVSLGSSVAASAREVRNGDDADAMRGGRRAPSVTKGQSKCAGDSCSGRGGKVRRSGTRAHNSAVECVLHTDEVAGSNPAAPTRISLSR
jgi:hypothetical protein